MKTIFISAIVILAVTTNSFGMKRHVEMLHTRNAAVLERTIEIKKPVDSVFNFIIYDLKDNYQAMAEGHMKYELLNSDYLEVGTEIDCREKTANQTVHHIYKVQEIVPNEHISFLSTPTKAMIELPKKTIESYSNTYCAYDLESIDANTTSLHLLISIQFESGFQKFMSRLFKGIAPWKEHQKEELAMLKVLIENS